MTKLQEETDKATKKRAATKRRKVFTVRDIEDAVWQRENIRVVFRLPGHTGSTAGHRVPYDFSRALGGAATINQLRLRLNRALGYQADFVVVYGTGKIIDITAQGGGRLATLLGPIHKSYN